MKNYKKIERWIKHKIIIIVSSLLLITVVTEIKVVNASEDDNTDLFELEIIIKRAKEIDRTGRTFFSLEQLDEALGKAISIYETSDSAQEEIQETIFTLQTAMDNLLFLPADKSNLSQAIQAALQLNKINKTKESLERLTAAIKKGEQFMNIDSYSQIEVDMMTEDIENAMKGLTDYPIYQVDKTQLEIIITKGLNIKHTIIQSEMLNKLIEAIKLGEEIFHSSKSTQEEIDYAATQISKIIKSINQETSQKTKEIKEKKEIKEIPEHPEVEEVIKKTENNKTPIYKNKIEYIEEAPLTNEIKYLLPNTSSKSHIPFVVSLIFLFIGFALSFSKSKIA